MFDVGDASEGSRALFSDPINDLCAAVTAIGTLIIVILMSQERKNASATAPNKPHAPVDAGDQYEGVRRRIAAAAKAEANALRRRLIRGAFTIEEWQVLHNSLGDLVDTTEGAQALGERYQQFMDYLDYDQRSINVQRRHETSWAEPKDCTPRRAAYESGVHEAHTTKNIAQVLVHLAPLLEAVGIPEWKEYEGISTRQITVSDRILSRPPPFA
jgi:hypothetical protein